MRTRAIYGCAGTKLSGVERDFYRAAQPWGFILFARNVVDRIQVRSLVNAMRECVGDEAAPVLIDQEGGRVMRLKPPIWKARPPQARFGELYAIDQAAGREAARLNARLIAHDLFEIGVNVDCLPLLDVPAPGSDRIIGDRAFASDPEVIVDLGRAVIDGLMAGGVLPVMKHMPGHGRATADSHLSLPRVSARVEDLRTRDFVTFRGLNHCPMAMTAHVVYEAIDAQNPATTSPKMIREVIRAEIGFDGLLMSDDISMGALSGPISGRTRASLFAGCDIVLHCNGKMDEMAEVAEGAGPLEGEPLRRSQRALASLAPPAEFDIERAEARLAELMGRAA